MIPYDAITDFHVPTSEDHELFRKVVRQFVDRYLEPKVKEIEETNSIPKELFKLAAENGFMGLGIPEDYGGQGSDYLNVVIFTEEVSRVCPAFSTATLVRGLFTTPVLIFGTEKQKRTYVPPLAKGQKFAAHATTEPGAGSDVAGVKTRAVRKDGGWVINGQKYFITGADKADYFVVLARTSEPPGRHERWRGLTMFIVERDNPGLRVGERIQVTGLRGSMPSEVILNDCWVSDDAVLGELGEGFKVAMTTYDYGRVGIAAQAVGVLQGVFEKSLNYAAQRVAFERPILAFQAIQFYLAEMLRDLEAARLLTYWAAHLLNKGLDERSIMAASLAKLFATEAAERASLRAIEIHGGMGVAMDGMVERFLRDTQIMKIYEGTSEIQRLVVVRHLVRKVLGFEV
ncbi:MAG: acyl-CoA dehydrogenase family protein [Thaumarchaeota archaeon]|nr:acyl-CoA dehydrogenase family protein [Candidatus Calditenuaceae archaeon]MDW8186598.1 acyl-CoA dehydrogenase family protein [Nitrososphaerota archaeon]